MRQLSARLPIVNVPLAQGREVYSVKFLLYCRSHTSIYSATLQRVLPLRMMMVLSLMKTMSLLLLHRPPIHNLNPRQGRVMLHLESMEAASHVSAFSTLSKVVHFELLQALSYYVNMYQIFITLFGICLVLLSTARMLTTHPMSSIKYPLQFR
ncbi:uncharacterized protein EDB93DRAFT_86058 [Suillus bovinus]|uniref:uncharacterized protein n=1 Tax=Suillus bovinus TaxID=48563 RepID=UPI001B873C00|nr:uncharacterized protein EDB93DRAFT_86058 [Suillus bovinus]KAG2130183.1 hypothetical protein EDB93DRAFT_86058 [Suillus bovinus]